MLKQLSEFSKILWYEVSIWKSKVFIYASNQKVENIFKKTIPFIIKTIPYNIAYIHVIKGWWIFWQIICIYNWARSALFGYLLGHVKHLNCNIQFNLLEAVDKTNNLIIWYIAQINIHVFLGLSFFPISFFIIGKYLFVVIW